MSSNSPTLDALIICRDCKRFLVVIHDGIRITIEDDQASLERSAVELLDLYIAEYQAELVPHTAKLIKLRALALSIRRLNARPKLP